jgi:hypothetical protein
LIAECWVESNRWLAVKVVVAVTRTGDTVDTADDDVCAQGISSTEVAVGVVGRADDV